MNKRGVDALYSTSTPNYFVSSIDGELATTTASSSYVARTENGSFNKYTFAGGYWTMTGKNGVVYKFGSATSSQQNDPNNSSNVYRWMLEQVEDTNGNIVSYRYFKDAGQIYPSSTIYTNTSSTTGIFQVDFSRVSNTDNGTSSVAGFPVKSNYRVSEINAKVNGTLARKYALGYAAGGNGTTALLRSILASGQNASGTVTTLPTSTFSYKQQSPGWTSNFVWGPIISFTATSSVDNGVRIADVNGDGLPDILKAYKDSSGTSHYDAYTNNNKFRADILTRLTYPQGGGSSVSYQSILQLTDDLGNVLNGVPYPVYIISTLATNNGTQNVATSTYVYYGGTYYVNGPFDHQFAGFTQVKETDPAGNVTKTFYHTSARTDSAHGEYQDNFWKIGKPYRIEAYDNASNLYRKIINKWDHALLGGTAAFVKLASTTESYYDGLATSTDKAESYSYENTTGNQTQKIQWGEVTASDNGSFTDMGTDKFATDISYVTSTTGVIGVPSNITVTDYSGNKVKESKYYYDNLSFGNVSAGNLTKREDWKTSSTYINIQNTYNSFGLVTQRLDPRGKQTTYAYDSYNLYAATTTNALSQSTGYEYDYASGGVTKTTDPNGNAFHTSYDGLGRVLNVKQPDPNATSTQIVKNSYAYTDTANSVGMHEQNYLGRSTGNPELYTTAYFSDANLVSYYRLEGNSNDAKGSNNGSDTSITYSTGNGKFNQGAGFNGSTSQINLGNSATLQNDTFSWVGWINPSALSGNPLLFGQNTSANGYVAFYILTSTGKLHLDKQGVVAIVAANTAIATSTWTHVAVTYNSSTGLGSIYLNGALNATSTSATTFSWASMVLGNRGSDQKYNGAMDDVAFFSRVLSASEVADLYNGADAGGFNNAANVTSSPLIAPGSVATTTFAGLTGDYRWQARVVDPANNGASAWTPFGSAATSSDFHLSPVLFTAPVNGTTTDAATFLNWQLKAVNVTSTNSFRMQVDWGVYATNEASSTANASGTQLLAGINVPKTLYSADYTDAGVPVDMTALASLYDTTGGGNVFIATTVSFTENTIPATAHCGSSDIQCIAYTYDPNGNITKIIEHASTSAIRTVDYTYDDLNRLITASSSNVSSTANYSHTYSYNALGNILSGPAGTYSYAHATSSYANPHAPLSITGTSTTNYAYDHNGNLTSAASSTYGWD